VPSPFWLVGWLAGWMDTQTDELLIHVFCHRLDGEADSQSARQVNPTPLPRLQKPTSDPCVDPNESIRDLKLFTPVNIYRLLCFGL